MGFILDACFMRNPDPAASLDDVADIVHGNGRFPDYSPCCDAWNGSFCQLYQTWLLDECGRVIHGVVMPEKIRLPQEETDEQRSVG